MNKKNIWYKEEKWEFVRWLCRAKDDRWILARKNNNEITDAGHECYKWATIDCGNETWLRSTPANDRLYQSLFSAQKKAEEIERKIDDKWCDSEIQKSSLPQKML